MDSILGNYPILSMVLGVSAQDATCDCQRRYNTFELRERRSDKVRTIDAPCPHMKQVQRALLDRILSHVEPHHAAMAFARGRSIAQNARRHLGASYLFTTDIRAFFPSITAVQVKAMLEARFRHLSPEAMKEIVTLVTREARLPQGAPTSPHLANLVMYDFDERCSWLCERLGAVYTRYADDIAISATDANVLHHLEGVVCDSLRAFGLEVHPEKTRHYGPHQRKTVTGLDIGGARIRPTRAFRKKAAALVRMTMKYPHKMTGHRDRICGHLAFWYDVDPADRDLAKLLVGMGLHNWAERVSKAADEMGLPKRERYASPIPYDDLPF